MMADDAGFVDHAQFSFDGLAERSAPLGWSQLYMWDFLSRMRPFDGQYNVFIETVAPDDLRIGDALGAIRELVTQHETLRTSYSADGSGSPRQRVLSSGNIDVGLIDETHLAGWLLSRQQASFERTEWPFDFVLAHRGGRVSRVMLIASHLVIDGWAGAVLRRQLAKRLSGAALELPQHVRQPVDQALWERTPAGQAANQSGLDLWRRAIAATPVGHFGLEFQSSRPRYRQGRLSSAVAGRRIRELAGRYRTIPSAVVLAAYACAVASAFDYRQTAFWIVIHNRFRIALQEAIGCYFREALICLDTTSKRAESLIADAASALLQAFRNTHTNPRQVSEVLSDADRGSYFDLARSFYYNFTMGPARGSSGADAQGPSIDWIGSKEFDGQLMYLNADLRGDVLTLRLMADTWCVTPHAVERILVNCLEQLANWSGVENAADAG